MTAEFFPEQTIRYKTYAKRTLVEALNAMFKNHPDEILQRTKATIEFPKTEVDYPSVVVRFFERQLSNAGVGHQETVVIDGESDSIEIEVNVPRGGSVQLTWADVEHAIGYKVYKGVASEKESQSFIVTANRFNDNGTPGRAEAVPIEVTGLLDKPQPVATVSGGLLAPGDYFYRLTALAPSQAVKFGHYFYSADIELAVYALSSYDRDLIADTLIQTITMGKFDTYTNTFFDRIYPKNDLFPDSELHFINVNSDIVQGFGESQTQTPWGAEDDLMYTTSYRFGVFGELYSLPPKLTYAMVRKIALYPWIGGIEPEPQGDPNNDAPWVSNDLAA